MSVIYRQAAIDAVMDELRRTPTNAIRAKSRIEALPSAQPDKTYEQGWKDGREALRKEIWEDGRDRLD